VRVISPLSLLNTSYSIARPLLFVCLQTYAVFETETRT